MLNKGLISRSEAQRLRNFGNKVSVYRQCANLPAEIFASRCHITSQELEAVEKGINNNVDTALALRMAQELGVSYADLFEADNERYYTNFSDDIVMSYVFRKCRKYKFINISKTLDIGKGNFSNWQVRNFIPSPFILGNILTLLKITPVELEGLKPAEKVEEPVEEVVETAVEEPANKADMMSQVIEACNLYKNIEVMRAELDEIIEKAQKLRVMLGGE